MEASYYEPDAIISGLDLSEDALACFRKNLAQLNSGISMRQGNAAETGLESESVDAIVSDLPWENQTELVQANLNSLATEFHRILKPQAKLALLCESSTDLIAALKSAKIKHLASYPISLHGKHPSIVLAQKAG